MGVVMEELKMMIEGGEREGFRRQWRMEKIKRQSIGCPVRNLVVRLLLGCEG